MDIDVGFEWDDVMFEEKENRNQKSNKKKDEKTEKQKNRKKKEQEIYEKEKEMIESKKPPETGEEYERLVVSSPNNSYIWIKYIAFCISMDNIEKARQICERALKTINFREENERMNIWVAYLNLESQYGEQEKMMKLFEKALQFNNQKKIYFHFVGILENNEKIELCDEIYQRFCKKFGQSAKVWKSYGIFQIKHFGIEKGRQVLQNALKSAPKRKHIMIISKFGQYEFKFGSAERGRTIFEGILTNYPKRVDLWSVYLDMEIKKGDQQMIRNLFERVITLNVSSKKIKFFFKRYLQYEKEEGNDERVEYVKQKAIEYVQSLISQN
eukprot:Anaeramoba_ignava/c21053_g3_i1.p1 GENE.c21053_g3_i1~~c21053_g3_i1.p1  ORF type:complete len:355 (+),score=161.26 c21053_g3_i1:85-1065(+)